jgi:hypothetical protein
MQRVSETESESSLATPLWYSIETALFTGELIFIVNLKQINRQPFGVLR